jgi:hypothetical protein
MRIRFTRDFYIPKGAEKIETPEAGTVAYLARGNYAHNGAPYFHAVAFHGKAEKPDWNYTFKTEQQAREYIATHATNCAAHNKRVADARKARSEVRAADHFKVGDLLHTSWGYDQTNVEFFKIVRVLEKTVEIVAIGGKTVEGSEGFMSCALRPDPDNVLTDEWETRFNGIHRVAPAYGGSASVCIHGHSNGYPIKADGQTYCSWYA